MGREGKNPNLPGGGTLEENIVVVCREGDEAAKEALEILREYGYRTRILTNEEPTEEDVFLFSTEKPKEKSGFNTKWTKVSPVKVCKVSPFPQLPFQIAIYHERFPSMNLKERKNFENALLNAVKAFEDFLCEGKLPWTRLPLDAKEMRDWLEKANRIRESRNWQRTYVVKLPKIALQREEKEKEALFVAAAGAFNFPVGMAMDDPRLHRIFQMTVKSYALLAELAKTGSGQKVYKLIEETSARDMARDSVILEFIEEQGRFPKPEEFKEFQEEVIPKISFEIEPSNQLSVLPRLESLIVFGKDYEDLSPKEREIADRCSLLDEIRHFARIMDIDALAEEKRIVGEAVAGSTRLLRMLGVAIDYRRRLNLIKPSSIAFEKEAEPAVCKGEIAYFARQNPPYVAALVSASWPKLAREMIDILRNLVAQYPLEMSIALLEDWLCEREPDPKASITACQIIPSSEEFELEIIGIGGGKVKIEGERETIIECKKVKEAEIGRYDFQQPIYRERIKVRAGETISFIPAQKDFVAQRVIIDPRRYKPIKPFEWNNEYIKQCLQPLFEEILQRQPERVIVEFGHIHSNRVSPGPEQFTAAKIARVLVEFLKEHGIPFETLVLIDNYHVYDILDYPKYLKELSDAFGEKISKITFEASLLTRKIGDEIISSIWKKYPDKILFVGGNMYLKVGGGRLIELYDGIGDGSKPGRQGCVPFEAGEEIRRLNPKLASALFKKWVLENWPNSIIAKWWSESPEDDFDTLTYKKVYLENPEKRAEKKQKMEEIDRPFKEKIGPDKETPFLKEILGKTDVGKVISIDILEGEYTTQFEKFAQYMALAGLPLNYFRIAFKQQTGMVKIFSLRKSAPS